MPIILASLVFAFALAALPSTEPPSPNEEEQARYVAYLKNEREKRRARIREREKEDQREKIRVERLQQSNLGNAQIEDFDKDMGEYRSIRRCKSQVGRSYSSELGLDINPGFDITSPNFSTRGRQLLTSQPRSQRLASDTFHSSTLNKSHKRHLRRSSSVPSTSTSSSTNTSPENSPGNSPKPFNTPLM